MQNFTLPLIFCFFLKDFQNKFDQCFYANAHTNDFRLFYSLININFMVESKKDQEKIAVCLAFALDLHTNCSKEEQRFLMISSAPKKFKNMWIGESNITSYTDQFVGWISQVETKIPKNKKASLNIFPPYSISNYLKVITFDGNLFVCEIEKSQELSFLSSPQINITGFYSVISKKFDSITITSIFDVSNPKLVFNRTFELKSNRELGYDL